MEYYEDILEDLDTEVEDMYIENAPNDSSVNNHKKDHDWKGKVDALIEKTGDFWRCIKCRKNSGNPQDQWKLRAHVENHLGGVHNCTICGHTNTTSTTLIQHMQRHHKEVMKNTKKFRYICNICSKGCKTSKGLIFHKYKHHRIESETKNKHESLMNMDIKNHDLEEQVNALIKKGQFVALC